MVTPFLLSRRGRRHGWRDRGRRPGPANRLGLVPLAGGAGIISWALAGHWMSGPDEGWIVSSTPEYLLTRGPYRYTRNPMYVGALAIWGGWTVYYGSARVAAGTAVIASGLQFAVAFEERTLVQKWGDEWREFAATTPRWLGRTSPR